MSPIIKTIEDSKKRKRSISELDGEVINNVGQLDAEAGGLELTDQSAKRQASMHMEGLELPGLIFPKSAYHGHVPPLPISREKEVLVEVLVSHCVVDNIPRRCAKS